MNFDYYYGDESNQFAFYRIPRQLITGEAFKKLSTDAKLLYGLLLDRMGLSAKNGWYDDMGRVFIYYTLDEIQEDLNCGHEKAVRLLAELDTGKKGFGLIERVKQGQGRPTKLYVKAYAHLFTEISPPIPKGQEGRFSVNGILLPGYTVEASLEERVEEMLSFLEDDPALLEEPLSSTHQETPQEEEPTMTQKLHTMPLNQHRNRERVQKPETARKGPKKPPRRKTDLAR